MTDENQTPTQWLQQARDLIAKDRLDEVFDLLRSSLRNNRLLDEVLNQSGQFHHIRQQIRLGVISHENAHLTKNQIRFGLLDLLREIEQEATFFSKQDYPVFRFMNIIKTYEREGGKYFPLEDLAELRFKHVSQYMEQEGKPLLPQQAAQHLLTENSPWPENLKQELEKYGSVEKHSLDVFQHYGWLIAEFLRRMQTSFGRQRSLRRLSLMTDSFQNSLRHLCFIQVAQIMKWQDVPSHPILEEFSNMSIEACNKFDYLSLLLVTTQLLSDKMPFVPEISRIAVELSDTENDLYGAVIFLHAYREKLLANVIQEDENFDNLLNEYLTALVFWLCKLAFLYEYRLVSINDIHLKYSLGMECFFVHRFYELHSMYYDLGYAEVFLKDFFTFNRSVLLLKGRDTKESLTNLHDPSSYLSLSPLVVDLSAYADKATQIPEIFYFAGVDGSGRQYHFAQYKNELEYEGQPIGSNKRLLVKAQNNQQPRLDELHEQLEKVFQPFKSPAR